MLDPCEDARMMMILIIMLVHSVFHDLNNGLEFQFRVCYENVLAVLGNISVKVLPNL